MTKKEQIEKAATRYGWYLNMNPRPYYIQAYTSGQVVDVLFTDDTGAKVERAWFGSAKQYLATEPLTGGTAAIISHLREYGARR